MGGLTMDTSNFWSLWAGGDWNFTIAHLESESSSAKSIAGSTQLRPDWGKKSVSLATSTATACNKLHRNHKQTKDRTRGLMKNQGLIGDQQAYFRARIRSQRHHRCHGHFLIFRALFPSVWPTTTTTTTQSQPLHTQLSLHRGVGLADVFQLCSVIWYLTEDAMAETASGGLWLTHLQQQLPLRKPSLLGSWHGGVGAVIAALVDAIRWEVVQHHCRDTSTQELLEY